MKHLLTFLFVVASLRGISQSPDAAVIKSIFNEELRNGKSYDLLHQLTKNVGQRLSGSEGAARGVEWGKQVMTECGFDSVWLQPVMVPHWVRGQKEVATVIRPKTQEKIDLSVCALGGSIGTGPEGIKAAVIEVKSIKELIELKNVKGKIVFFNRPMDPTQIQPFVAYGGAVDQRAKGPSVAGKLGAVAVIVRSMGINPEDYPHTGALVYARDTVKIPAIAVSTRHADLLSKLVAEDKGLELYIETHCEILPDVESFNVVGQMKGSDFKDQIILVGGHLDSWDLGEGAHDDGAGCVHSIEAIRVLNSIGYKPRRTLRAVLFMNEENGTMGAAKYAELAVTNREKYLAAIESDAGGFTPRGFGMTGTETAKSVFRSWKPLLEPYGLASFAPTGGGADIGPLGKQGANLISFLPDGQRYFDYHHTREDTFDKVSKREIEMGSAAIASLIYLLDVHGL